MIVLGGVIVISFRDGEYGFPADRYTPQDQDTLSRRVMRTGIGWGCPFVLYWEIYNNEIYPDGRQRGFWLIDDKNVKQPAYFTHERFLQAARKDVSDEIARTGRVPGGEEYRKKALEILENQN